MINKFKDLKIGAIYSGTIKYPPIYHVNNDLYLGPDEQNFFNFLSSEGLIKYCEIYNMPEINLVEIKSEE